MAWLEHQATGQHHYSAHESHILCGIHKCTVVVLRQLSAVVCKSSCLTWSSGSSPQKKGPLFELLVSSFSIGHRIRLGDTGILQGCLFHTFLSNTLPRNSGHYGFETLLVEDSQCGSMMIHVDQWTIFDR